MKRSKDCNVHLFGGVSGKSRPSRSSITFCVHIIKGGFTQLSFFFFCYAPFFDKWDTKILKNDAKKNDEEEVKEKSEGGEYIYIYII